MRASCLALVVALATVALAGCGSKGATDMAATTSTVATSTTAPLGSSTTPSVATEVSTCPVASLQAMVGKVGLGAGSSYTPIILTNTSGHACTLVGYPEVTLFDNSGAQVGSASTNYEPPITSTAVALAPGQQAYIVLVMQDGTGGVTCPAAASTARIELPHQAAPLRVDGSFLDCGDSLQTTTFAAGASGVI